MEQLKEARLAYTAIAPPPDLDEVVKDAVRLSRLRTHKPSHHGGRIAASIAACLCLAFVITLNSAPALAMGLYELPVLGQVARVCTLWRFEESTEASYVRVNMPALENTGNTELEQRINYEIAYKVNEKLDDAKARAKEFYDAFLATGGKADEFIPMDINIDYQVTCNDGKRVSFVISQSETQASFYAEYDYYNIDMETGRELTLSNLLGGDYIEKVNRAVLAGIAADEAANPDDLYFHDELAFQSIEPDQPFYINEQGHVVVVFNKYEIAPGYMGVRRFEILPE